MLKGIWRDLIHAVRSLARARAFTCVCVVSLGIGMALVIAVRYWARVLRTPPPGVIGEGLVGVVKTPREAEYAWSYPDFEVLREANTGIAMTGWKRGESTIAVTTPSGVRATSVTTMFVSPNYFRTIGVALARGAGFDQTGNSPSAAPEVILSHDYWQNNTGADPNIIGKTLTLDDIPHIVVGVGPEHFSGHISLDARQLFLPLGRYPPLRTDERVRADRRNEWLWIVGRLSPGVTVNQASAAVAAVTSQLATQDPTSNERKAGMVESYGSVDAPDFRIIQTLAFTLTGAVLVVVCLNMSGMMLVRSAMRERELSIRHAIGASRGRLAQYLLCEAVVLASLGAILGSFVIVNAPPLVSWWNGLPLPFEIQQAVRLEPSIIAFCGGLCLATSVVFGLWPAARFSRPVIVSSLKDDAGVGGFQAGRVHRWAAALQVAIAVPLMVLCALALDRVRVTATADLGFAYDRLYAAPLRFDDVADGNAEFRIRSARANLKQATGVASVTVADHLPLAWSGTSTRISLQRDVNAAPTSAPVYVTRVGDDYLNTMGIPLLSGRGFTTDDAFGSEMVTVISKTLADKLVPDADAGAAIGQRLTFGAGEKTPQSLTVVGVTGDFPTPRMDSNREQLLLPLAQHPSPNVFLVVRSAPGESPMKVTAALENATIALGPNVNRSLTYGDDHKEGTVVTGVWLRQRSIRDFLVRSTVVGGVGSVILVLATLGIYGVVGLMIASRTREIAVRAALGASRRRMVRMILFDVVRLVMPGAAVGLLLAVAVGRLPVNNTGIKLSSAEPLAYLVGASIVVFAAVLASFTHARRAASVHPMVAMRST